MIPWREGFDATKARALEASRQDDVPVDPILPYDKCGETHADLESDPRLFGEDDDRPAPLCDRQQFVEDRAHALRLSCEMGRQGVAATARVGLISIRKPAPALWAAPQRWIGRSVRRCFILRLRRHFKYPAGAGLDPPV
jgi:hypothetical protein